MQDPKGGQEFARVNNTLKPDSMQVQACRQAASEFIWTTQSLQMLHHTVVTNLGSALPKMSMLLVLLQAFHHPDGYTNRICADRQDQGAELDGKLHSCCCICWGR